jgi:PmbA protein
MTEREALEIAADAVRSATQAGAGAAEATFSHARRFHVEARDKTISKLEQSIGATLHVRLFLDGRRVTLSTSDVTREAVQSALREAVEQAREVAPDALASLPERCSSCEVDLRLFDQAIAQRDDALKVDDVLELEKLIRDADSRVVNSSGSHYSDASSITALANSSGFAAAYTGTRASLSSAPVAEHNDVKRTGHYGTAGRFFRDLESRATVSRVAARRAVELFGARKPKTARLPVIFERDVAAAVLDDLFAAVNGGNVSIGNSWLAERLGERIGSDLITIVDDGTLPEKLGSSPFDGEGVATRRTPVFEAGTLRSFLFDTYYARKLGAQSTGNSTGGGIGPNNFYLEPGSQSLDDLIASTATGVLVLDTIGFATEHATGNYSRGARGFMIENGELSYPIDEFTVAGNFADMLAAVDAVANDLRFDSSVVSPSFRVAEMTVSGS